jgi:hypothetical protein
MLREAEVRFSVQDQLYNTPTRKAYYVLSLFKEGNAKLWKEQYLRRREGKTLCDGNSWDQFKAILNESFKDVGSQDDAISGLQSIKQNPRQTVDEYNTKFRILVQKAGLDEQENAALLIQSYTRGLNREIGKRIIIQEPPTTLSGWMSKASTLDGYQRRADNFYAQALGFSHKNKGKSTWKPRNYAPKERDEGGPMDIDRLEPQEEKRRKDNDLCFNCGKPGHRAADCRSKREGHDDSHKSGKGKAPSFKRNFQGNQQGGKRQKNQVRVVEANDHDKAETTRNAIRKIISDSYEDQESESYLRFVEQVQEMGF